MTITNTTHVSIADALTSVAPGGLPFRFTAYDGSSAGPEDAAVGMHLANERGLSYVLTAPGDLGMVRAYAAGDLELYGVHPGNPYGVARLLATELCRHRSAPRAGAARSTGCGTRGTVTRSRSSTTTTSRTGSTS